jgi:class 3 adenylate cyclase
MARIYKALLSIPQAENHRNKLINEVFDTLEEIIEHYHGTMVKGNCTKTMSLRPRYNDDKLEFYDINFLNETNKVLAKGIIVVQQTINDVEP